MDALEQVLVAERPRLVGMAYRITGSRVEAEDIVQEAWLRARAAGAEVVERPAAWLTTVVSRLALDSLKSARRRRESYVGPYLPEPVRTPAGASPGGVGAAVASATPEDGAEDLVERAESLTFGFLRVLDALSPVERVVFLLADVFEVPYAEIAEVVGRSPEACRQVASRARRRVRAGRPARPAAGAEEARRVAGELIDALGAGDVARVVSLLGEDVVLVSDGGPDFRAARKPIDGAQRVGRFITSVVTRFYRGITPEPVTINGEPGLVLRADGRARFTMAIRVADGVVTDLHIVVNPDKLAAFDAGPLA
jgi:RNA polymerase sigma-70 factor (ECF subfamily)